MTKSDAVKWCNTYLIRWPNSCDNLKIFTRPSGWKWVVSSLPYQLDTYKMVNGNHSEIDKNDVVLRSV